MNYTYELVKMDENLPIKVIVHSSDEETFVPRHWHDSVEISYVIQGRIDAVYIDGTTYAAKKGDIIVINSNAVHSFTVAQGKDRMAITILIPYAFLQASFPEINRFTFDCISRLERDSKRLLKFDELRCILDRIVTVYLNRERDPFATIELKGLTYNLLLALLKNFMVNRPDSGVIKTKKHQERLTSITSYIQQRYHQELSLERLAVAFGLSKEYLSRFFKRHLGMTVLQYINAVRLEKAYRDLMNTDHPITRIVYEHGFPNEKSFNRVFKSVYKVTPHEYRLIKQRRSQEMPVKKS